MIQSVKVGLSKVLPKSTFAKSVSVMAGGTAGSQLIAVLAAPILTRIYTPEHFGLLAVYASLLALIGVVASLRYELAIPLPESDVAAANVAVLCLGLVGIATFLTVVLVVFAGQPVAELLGTPALASYFWLLPVGVLVAGAFNVFNYWSVRTKRFSLIARATVRQSLATIAIQLTAFKLGGVALLFGQVAGQGVGTFSLGKPALASASFKLVSSKGVATAAKRYRRFPIFTTWAGLFNTAGAQLPPILIAGFFSVSGAGLFALAHRILTLPVTLFGSALQSVFLSGAAQAYRNNELGVKVSSLLNILTQIAVPPALVLVLVAPDLFELVFGSSWREAGIMAQWMAPWLVLQFCTGPLTIVNAVTENQHLGLLMQVQLFVVRVAMLSIGILYADLLLAIQLFALGSAISYFLFLWVVLWISKVSILYFLKSLTRATIFGVAVVAPLLLFPDFLTEISTAIAVCLAVVVTTTARFLVLYRYKV